MRDAVTRGESQEIIGEHLSTDEGNALLHSLGLLGRDFRILLDMKFSPNAKEIELFQDPLSDLSRESTLLERIQSDIYQMRQGAAETGELPKIDSSDKSIRIHSCHSPMREVQVLCDQLLDLFENDSSIKPHDVIVMTPNIETYSPYIEAGRFR